GGRRRWRPSSGTSCTCAPRRRGSRRLRRSLRGARRRSNDAARILRDSRFTTEAQRTQRGTRGTIRDYAAAAAPPHQFFLISVLSVSLWLVLSGDWSDRWLI